jgi:cytochrome P450
VSDEPEPRGAEALWREMMMMDGAVIDLEVTRERVQAGRSFSPEAMEALTAEMTLWVATRIARRWEQTSEPPSVLRVTVTAEVG